jgi:hypothetical protein
MAFFDAIFKPQTQASSQEVPNMDNFAVTDSFTKVASTYGADRRISRLFFAKNLAGLDRYFLV